MVGQTNRNDRSVPEVLPDIAVQFQHADFPASTATALSMQRRVPFGSATPIVAIASARTCVSATA